MNCEDFRLNASIYIDNMLSNEEKTKFETHIKECSNCNIAFQNLKIIVESTNMIEEVELPQNFSAELHEKLQNIKSEKTKLTKFKKNRVLNSAAAVLVIFVISLSLINNFSISKKDAKFYSGANDSIMEESSNISMASDSTKEEAMQEEEGRGPIMPLRMAPAPAELDLPMQDDARDNSVNEQTGKESSIEQKEERVLEYSKKKHYNNTEVLEDIEDENVVVEKEDHIQEEKNWFGQNIQVSLLALAAALVFLIYKIRKG